MNKNFCICNTISIIIFIVLSGSLIGCKGILDKPALKITNYTLEYEPPDLNSGKSMLPVHLKIERFTSAPEYRTKKIIYRNKANVRNSYNYHSWSAYPSDIVGYLLLRDFSRSGLFKTVTGFTDMNIAPAYIINGILEEFYEKGDSDMRMAVASVDVIMVSCKEKDVINGTILQKNYKAETPCIEKTPEGLASAMSVSVENISKRIMDDIYSILESAI